MKSPESGPSTTGPAQRLPAPAPKAAQGPSPRHHQRAAPGQCWPRPAVHMPVPRGATTSPCRHARAARAPKTPKPAPPPATTRDPCSQRFVLVTRSHWKRHSTNQSARSTSQCLWPQSAPTGTTADRCAPGTPRPVPARPTPRTTARHQPRSDRSAPQKPANRRAPAWHTKAPPALHAATDTPAAPRQPRRLQSNPIGTSVIAPASWRQSRKSSRWPAARRRP